MGDPSHADLEAPPLERHTVRLDDCPYIRGTGEETWHGEKQQFPILWLNSWHIADLMPCSQTDYFHGEPSLA